MVPSNSCGNNHRQNAPLVTPQKGVITEKSHWGWNVGTVVLILGTLFLLSFPKKAEQFFALLGSLI